MSGAGEACRGWLLQEITVRFPGRIEGATTFSSATELAATLRRAGAAHGEHEKRTGGEYDVNWPDWYAEYIVQEQAGGTLPLWRGRNCFEGEFDPIRLADKHCLAVQIEQGIKTRITRTYATLSSFSDNRSKFNISWHSLGGIMLKQLYPQS